MPPVHIEGCERPNPLFNEATDGAALDILVKHSDCDGELTESQCKMLDALFQKIKVVPEEKKVFAEGEYDDGLRDVIQQFVDAVHRVSVEGGKLVFS